MNDESPARITVLGATGGTGRQVVHQALDAGHPVTALVRDPARLPIAHERLDVVRMAAPTPTRCATSWTGPAPCSRASPPRPRQDRRPRPGSARS